MKKIKAVKRKRIRGMERVKAAKDGAARLKAAVLYDQPDPVARPTAWLDLFVITSAMVAIAAMVVILVNEAWG